MKYSVATASRLGNRHMNQDRFDVIEGKNSVLLVMADGMGGHKGGEIAAEVACQAAAVAFNKRKFPIVDAPQFLRNIVVQCQAEIIQAGLDHAPEIEPKTTLVLCFIQNGDAIWAHVGDSRVYIIREEVILEQTVDHSSVERLYQLGKITEAEKSSHPTRNLVTQCMGARNSWPRPSISDVVTLRPHDVLLLCSDGFWGQLDKRDIKRGFSQPNMHHCLDVLAGQAESNAYPRSDNISAVALRWISNKDICLESFSDHEIQDLIDSVDDINRAVDDIQKLG